MEGRRDEEDGWEKAWLVAVDVVRRTRQCSIRGTGSLIV